MLKFPADFSIPTVCGHCGNDVTTGVHTDDHGKVTLVAWPCQCTEIERVDELESENFDLEESYCKLLSLINDCLLPTIRLLGPDTSHLQNAEKLVQEMIQDEHDDS